MFFNHLKDFIVKKQMFGRYDKLASPASHRPIKFVGLLFDDSYQLAINQVLSALHEVGITINSCDVLLFSNSAKKSTVDAATFSYRDLHFNATLKSPEVTAFIDQPYDLLISYYDIEKAPLMLATHLSKAYFKVGFSSTNSQLHHFMLACQAENSELFAAELVKYLRIFKMLPA